MPSDDSALLSLLQGSEQYHGPALTEFVDWCDNSYLDLNVTKTKEMIVDFRRHMRNIVLGRSLSIITKLKLSVNTDKYLGTIFDKLKWDDNIEEIVKGNSGCISCES